MEGSTRFGHPSARIHRGYVDERTLRNLVYKPNLIICRHSIDYFEDPATILHTLREISQERSFIFIETPSVDRTFITGSVEDFCYERQSFFGETALLTLMRESGWLQTCAGPAFERQYLRAWGVGALPSDVGDFGELWSYAERPRDIFSSVAAAWEERLRAARRLGAVAIWGTGSKGMMFSALTDASGGMLDCGIDINPRRQGKFLPVSGLQVMSPKEASARKLRTILIMNPAYVEEIKQIAQEVGISATFETLAG